VWQRYRETETLAHSGLGCKMAQLFQRAVYLKNAHIELPYNPAIIFLRRYPEGMKELKELFVHLYPSHHSQQPKGGSNPNFH
jgi:hypothetical protein